MRTPTPTSTPTSASGRALVRRRLALGTSAAALAGVLAVLVEGTSATAAPAPAAAPAAKPAATLSLTGWNLTLPVDSSGCQCGDAEQLDPAAITAPWLTRNSAGALVFWAPTEGATTPNSAHPRTELVSDDDFTGDGSGTHVLSSTLSVQQLPPAGDIVIGQIHGGGSSSSIPFVLLHYTSGSLVVWARPSPSAGSTKDATLLTGVPLNGSFSYTLTESGKKVEVSVSYDGRQAGTTISLPSGFDGMDLRFQAGDYQQSDANQSSTEGGRLTVTALSQN